MKQRPLDAAFLYLLIGNTEEVITTAGTNRYDKIITTRKRTLHNHNLKHFLASFL